jgi:predicted nucleic acid-binding Zn ribbon protein
MTFKKKVEQRHCVICARAYSPHTSNQKYCLPACRKKAEEWRSIKRDTLEFALSIKRRINKMLDIK